MKASGRKGHDRFGAIEVDFEHKRVSRKGQAIELTEKEFALLELLIQRRGKIVTRERLLAEVWGAVQLEQPTRTVDIHMSRLRGKLAKDSQYILTVIGRGYVLLSKPLDVC